MEGRFHGSEAVELRARTLGDPEDVYREDAREHVLGVPEMVLVL